MEAASPSACVSAFLCLFSRVLFIYLFLKILFIYERHKERGRGRSRLHAGSLTWDLIPGLQDHALGWRQGLNCWATQGSPIIPFYSPWPAQDSGGECSWMLRVLNFKGSLFSLDLLLLFVCRVALTFYLILTNRPEGGTLTIWSWLFIKQSSNESIFVLKYIQEMPKCNRS